VVACNQQTIQTPLRSFDRPSDVALVCAQYDYTNGKYDVRRVGDCEPLAAQAIGAKSATAAPGFAAALGPSGPVSPFLLALVPQSARGELAIVDTAQNKKVDADPLKPGFGFLPVGKMPEHVRVSSDGCWALTTNADSCDYGRVELPTVINRSLLS